MDATPARRGRFLLAILACLGGWALLLGGGWITQTLAAGAAAGAVPRLANGALEGYIYDDETGNPLENAIVRSEPGGMPEVFSDDNGYYTLTLAAGSYTVTALKTDYLSVTVPAVAVLTDTVTQLDYYLTYQPGYPVMEVTAPPLVAQLYSGEVVTLAVTLHNPGIGPLLWTIEEGLSRAVLQPGQSRSIRPGASAPLPGSSAWVRQDPAALPPFSPLQPASELLWDQPSDHFAAVASQSDPSGTFIIFSADDFTLDDLWWAIDAIFIDGKRHGNASGSLPQAEQLTWVIYPDFGGEPGGSPLQGGQLWSYTATPLSTGVVITGEYADQVRLDLAQVLGGPLYLPSGRYWLSFYPTLDYAVYGQWLWDSAESEYFNIAHLIDVENVFGMGWTDWTPWNALEPNLWDAAFSLEGQVPNDLPWVLEDPLSGTLPAGESTSVTVSLSAVGLIPGDYFGTLIVRGNDPYLPSVDLPVSLNVVRRGVKLSPELDVLVGGLGERLVHAFSLVNSGTVVDTYDLSLTGANWSTFLETDRLVVLPGASATVLVWVDIPSIAENGASDEAVLRATSVVDPAISITATSRTELEFIPVYGVDLEPGGMAGEGVPGSQVEYQLTVVNTGNLTDTFDLAADSLWTVQFSTPNLTLPPGAGLVVIVDVNVPLDALVGGSIDATVTATSRGDPATNAAVFLTTTCIDWKMRLPVILR